MGMDWTYITKEHARININQCVVNTIKDLCFEYDARNKKELFDMITGVMILLVNFETSLEEEKDEEANG